jgi:hypothetical protein
VTENINPVKSGDILIALYNGREVRGEVSVVYENYFLLKGKNGSSIKVTLNDVTEHYPKNRAFENKISPTNLRKFTEAAAVPPPPVNPQAPTRVEKPVGRVQQKNKKIVDEEEEEQQEEKNSPDNQVDLTIENIKKIGKLIYYKDIKFSQIESMFEKKLLSKDEYWYLLTEKGNEIHVIRNNNKAFEIQPFVNALVGHFLKSQNKLINESFGQIKVSGNDNFSVITNIPQNVHEQLLNSIIALLSGIKK